MDNETFEAMTRVIQKLWSGHNMVKRLGLKKTEAKLAELLLGGSNALLEAEDLTDMISELYVKHNALRYRFIQPSEVPEMLEIQKEVFSQIEKILAEKEV